MALTCSLTQIFTFERWTKDFEQETGSSKKSMVFCYLYKLFWEMHLLFCKCWGWFEKCTKAPEKSVIQIHTHALKGSQFFSCTFCSNFLYNLLWSGTSCTLFWISGRLAHLVSKYDMMKGKSTLAVLWKYHSSIYSNIHGHFIQMLKRE